ncbi:ganglioside-induced differentiation-associated protein 1-like [Pomacea canaliculata]|uniref:ganglioside-induced differentiation-associated protein 1-like n=1 Tax=Pomacea canaliculata TaxID=400727 RepID=UPI000D72B835|nr:ganglioside-induced differentiation-associated protein 1-like [Pomacea canaliculata]
MDRRLKLYYHPTSYFSQKVLIALQEKNVKYDSHTIEVHKGQQLEPWYMRINSAGQVPTLQDGEKIVKESEDIVDYIDREFPNDSKLIPDLSTEVGKEVVKWRKLLHAVPVVMITYGLYCNPELSTSGLKIPKCLFRSKEDILVSFQLFEKKMEQLSDLHPDLREAYLAKICAIHDLKVRIDDKEGVVRVLMELESTLDQVEEQLNKVDADPSKELWFCGQQFTAADITLCVLMGRLDLLGLSERYHSKNKRLRLHQYWLQAKKRPTINRVVVNVRKEMMKQRLKKNAMTALPLIGGLVALGLAAGLAFVFAQKR